MMRAFAFAVLAGLVGSAFAIEPRRDDFAYQAPIELSEPGSIYRAPLTAHVYQGVTRGDLGDLRVYNAADEAVAHGLTRPSIEPGKRLIELPSLLCRSRPAANRMTFRFSLPPGMVARLSRSRPGRQSRESALPTSLMRVSRKTRSLHSRSVGTKRFLKTSSSALSSLSQAMTLKLGARSGRAQ